jgi:hypothetical protein
MARGSFVFPAHGGSAFREAGGRQPPGFPALTIDQKVKPFLIILMIFIFVFSLEFVVQ